MEKNKITSEYLHALQAIYHHIGMRGIKVNQARLKQAETFINDSIIKECIELTKLWGCPVYVGSENNPGIKGSVNLNASSGSSTALLKMQELGYKIPKISSRDEEGNYVSKESLGELALQKMYALNQFNTPGGDPAIRALLSVRELNTLKTRYINAELLNIDGNLCFISDYSVSGTVTGRRGSKQHIFGYGGNQQNFPKHGKLAKKYRRCLVSRDGMIFLSVDQMQAEDWPVSALANNTNSLAELRAEIDRHKKLACSIYNLPENHYDAQGWKDSIERFMGKKTRHANNYGMRGSTMSDSLSKEGISMSAAHCQYILDTVNKIDPSVQGVFHEYVKQCLYKDRILRTPLGRERQFFGLRAGDTGSNNKIFNEAFSYIPQSTVGDNTGFAVYELETTYKIEESKIVQEGHDSIIQEIPATVDSIWDNIQRTIKSFDRPITFYNGIEINIPVEGEIGFDFAHSITLKARNGSKQLKNISYQDVQAAFYKLQQDQEKALEEDAEYARSAA